MSPFEFYFSFYGLLLGFSVAEVTGGFSAALKNRNRLTLGWLTPLLSVVILIDIMNFWLFAWASRDSVIISWGLMTGGLFVAVTYYLAASMVYPTNWDDFVDIDQHYWKQKKFVVGGIALSNIIVLVFTLANSNVELRNYSFFAWQIAYWGPLIGLAISRWRAIDLALLVALIAQYFIVGLGLFSQR